MTEGHRDLDDEDESGRSKTQDRATQNLMKRFGTAYNELESVQPSVQERISTTHSMSLRHVVQDGSGAFLTDSEADALFNHEPPLLTATLDPGQERIIRSQTLNQYEPGSESVTGIGFQSLTAATDGYVPPGVIVEIGFASHKEPEVDGDPLNSDGFVLRYTNSDVEYLAYKNNNEENSRSVEEGEWNIDIFDNKEYLFDPTQFAVYRNRMDLYGGGQSELEMRLRAKNNEDGDEILPDAHTIRPVDVANENDPLLSEFNQPMSVRVINGSDSAYSFGVGPMQFHTLGLNDGPSRDTEVIKTDVSISSSLGDNTGTIVGIFRLDPDKPEVPVILREMKVELDSTSQVEARIIRGDYLTSTTSLTDDSNWVYPKPHLARDTAIEMLDVAPGDVTIDTFTDEDGQTKMRGHTTGIATTQRQLTNTGGKRSDWTLDRQRYIVFTARTRNQTAITEFDAIFQELW